MQVGLLTGLEDKFPRALLKDLEGRGVAAGRVVLGPVGGGHDLGCEVLVDRVSHRVPFYRAAVERAAQEGVRVINPPWTWIDRFNGLGAAARLGLWTPRAVLLPQKGYPADLPGAALRNLAYPLDWDAILAAVGGRGILTALSAAHDLPMRVVTSVPELLSAFDASGTTPCVLEEALPWDRWVRAFVIGGEAVVIGCYDLDYRQVVSDGEYLTAEEATTVRDTALLVTRTLGLDINAVDVAFVEGESWVMGASDPVPDLEAAVVGRAVFEQVVGAVAELCLGLMTSAPAVPAPEPAAAPAAASATIEAAAEAAWEAEGGATGGRPQVEAPGFRGLRGPAASRPPGRGPAATQERCRAPRDPHATRGPPGARGTQGTAATRGGELNHGDRAEGSARGVPRHPALRSATLAGLGRRHAQRAPRAQLPLRGA